MLQELMLSNNLIQTLPASMSDMFNLEILNLSGNKIRELPKELGNFKKLRKLNVAQNQIQSIHCQFEPGNLEFIDLSKNQISSLGIVSSTFIIRISYLTYILEYIVYLPKQETNIFINNLAFLIIVNECFFHLSKLKILDLGYNKLESFFEFPGSDDLENVVLSYNRINSLGNLSRCPQIKTLDLKNNKLKTVPDEIFNLESIKLLDVSNNDISKVPYELGLMKSLGKIFLEGNAIRSIRHDIMTGPTEKLKTYLKSRINYSEIKKPSNSGSDPSTSNANLSRIKLVEKEFGGPREKRFSELVPRNSYNKICSLVNMNISKLDMVNPEWSLLTIDFSKNQLTTFPTELASLSMLKVLKLDENLIPEIFYKDLAGFRALEQLEIKKNNLKRFCLDFDEMPLEEKEAAYLNFIKVS